MIFCDAYTDRDATDHNRNWCLLRCAHLVVMSGATDRQFTLKSLPLGLGSNYMALQLLHHREHLDIFMRIEGAQTGVTFDSSPGSFVSFEDYP